MYRELDLSSGLGAPQAPCSRMIPFRGYKLQLFIVIVLLLLLVIINNMLGNSLARENEPCLMEGCPGRWEKGTGCEGKIQERVCVVYYKLSFDLSFMAGLDFPFNWNSRILWLKYPFTEWMVYVGCFQEGEVQRWMWHVFALKRLTGEQNTHKNPITRQT